MRACGISLYRTAAPLLVFGGLASGALFLMQERVLAQANREADRLERIIRRWPPATSPLNRRWIVGTTGEMYHYDLFDPDSNRFSGLWVYRVDQASWNLRAITRVSEATASPAIDDGTPTRWTGQHGWTRELGDEHRRSSEKAAIKKLLAGSKFLLPVHDKPAKIEGAQVVGRLDMQVPGPVTQSVPRRDWFPA